VQVRGRVAFGMSKIAAPEMRFIRKLTDKELNALNEPEYRVVVGYSWANRSLRNVKEAQRARQLVRELLGLPRGCVVYMQGGTLHSEGTSVWPEHQKRRRLQALCTAFVYMTDITKEYHG